MSQKRTDEEFKNLIYSVRDDIEILNEYETKHSTMICRCKIHPHYTFSIKACNLKGGHGKCKICRLGQKKLEGQKFGRLLVLELDESVSLEMQKAHWKCLCDCGKELIVFQASLLTGNTTSCGCAKSDATIKFNKEHKTKKNEYRFINGIGIGKCFNKDWEFYFDEEDFDVIKDYCWFEDGHGYIEARDKKSGKTVKMHRLIMGLDFGDAELVDHKNHNRSDNRKSNLRVCDKSKNGMNSNLQSNNTSGVCGVSLDANRGLWQAYITKEGTRYRLGYFAKYDDAVSCRKKAEEELFGEFSFDNSSREEEYAS